MIRLTHSGLGCVGGSLLGGRWSDYKLAKLKEANGGKSYPEVGRYALWPEASN